MLSQLLALAYDLIRPGTVVVYAVGYWWGVKDGREEHNL